MLAGLYTLFANPHSLLKRVGFGCMGNNGFPRVRASLPLEILSISPTYFDNRLFAFVANLGEPFDSILSITM